jgi:hypothetical protein
LRILRDRRSGKSDQQTHEKAGYSSATLARGVKQGDRHSLKLTRITSCAKR